MNAVATLPDKPSELIRLAISDLEKCEGDDRYKVDMNHWHFPNFRDKVCVICLAGSVIAKSLLLEPSRVCVPGDFVRADRGLYSKLWALESFRSGRIADGLRGLGFDLNNLPTCVDITDYGDDPAAFKAEMRQLADDLEGAGL